MYFRQIDLISCESLITKHLKHSCEDEKGVLQRPHDSMLCTSQTLKLTNLWVASRNEYNEYINLGFIWQTISEEWNDQSCNSDRTLNCLLGNMYYPCALLKITTLKGALPYSRLLTVLSLLTKVTPVLFIIQRVQ